MSSIEPVRSPYFDGKAANSEHFVQYRINTEIDQCRIATESLYKVVVKTPSAESINESSPHVPELSEIVAVATPVKDGAARTGSPRDARQ